MIVKDLFSRYLGAKDLADTQATRRPDLQALVVVANPDDTGSYGLAPVDVDGEVSRVRTALQGIPSTVLAYEPD